MNGIASGAVVMVAGRKGPVDWRAHRAESVLPEGGVILACSIGNKTERKAGARRCLTVSPDHYPYVHTCPECWPRGLP